MPLSISQLSRLCRSEWSQLAPATRRLLALRFWRSISQGTLVVDLALFLHALGWSGAFIGLVLSAGGLSGAALNLMVGVTSDRLRRKPFLIAYELLTCVCAVLVMWTSDPVLLAVGIVLAGFGRGANGAAGVFAPAEQAWLAEAVSAESRGMVYSLNSAIGFGGMALGALVAALPPLLIPFLGPVDCFRPLFGLVLLGNCVNLFLLAGTPEAYHRHPAVDRDPPPRAPERHLENGFLWRLVGLNAFNGFAVGLTGPLMAYWFARRFMVGPSQIGPVLAATFVVTGLGALFFGTLTRRLGLVRAVVWGRSGGVLLMFMLPFMPFYSLASCIYILRSALNRGTAGARQALVISAVAEERRGLASSLNALSMQVPRSLGPALAGALIGSGRFALPFLIAGALQGIYVALYGRVFGRLEKRTKLNYTG